MSRSESDGRLIVYSDYVCPFCYLGKAALDGYLASAEDPPTVEWRPFDLRGYRRGPDGTVRDDIDDGKDEAYFARVRENVARLRERYGVEMALDVAREVDSWNAQAAARFVEREHGEAAFERFHGAVFRALWADGRDIGDPAVLAAVADEVGLAGEAVGTAVGDEAVEAALREAFDGAREAGIRAIPTFVYGEHAAQGAIPPEQFERLVEGF